MSARPRYALPEIERRWLVDPEQTVAGPVLETVEIRDCYLRDTRLRLRAVRRPGGATDYKLCKKYGDRHAHTESIVNVYLSAAEYAALASLPAWVVDKARWRYADGSLDRYGSGGESLQIFEREFEDPALAAADAGPRFAARDVTTDPAFSGLALAQRFGRLHG